MDIRCECGVVLEQICFGGVKKHYCKQVKGPDDYRGLSRDVLRAENERLRKEIGYAIQLLIPIDSGKWWRRADKIRCGLEQALKD